jgi:hypothetical protein
MPYKAPNGFFETFSERTLQKAIQKERVHKKNNLIRLIFSAAASVALLLYLGFHFMGNSDFNADPNLLVQDTLPINKTAIQTKLETPEKKTGMESKKINTEKATGKNMTTIVKTEVLSDVLRDLTDDELQQLAALDITDPFINESLQ